MRCPCGLKPKLRLIFGRFILLRSTFFITVTIPLPLLGKIYCMFNRYWRSYPWYIQLIQFIVLMVVMFSFFGLAVPSVILKMNDIGLDQILSVDEHSPRKMINTLMWLQFFQTLGLFLVPALMFAYFAHPRPAEYLGMRKPGKPIQWVLVIVTMLAATPLLLLIGDLFSKLNIGNLKQTQEDNERLMRTFLSMHSPLQLIFSFFIVAILPGIAEEFFFRGLLMRFSAKRAPTPYFSIIVAAIIFAMMHTNIYGMVSIFIAGMLLGCFYYFTGSLWCSVLAHICFNGLQVVMIYTQGKDPEQTISQSGTWLFVTVSTLIAIGAFYLLWKNRTPLPFRWASDYTLKELQQEQNQ